MADQTVAELILKIIADSSEVRKELQSAVDAEKKFAKDTKESSSEAGGAVDKILGKSQEQAEKTKRSFSDFSQGLRQVSRNLTFLGTAMVSTVMGPMAAAAKVSGQVRGAMWELGTAAQNLSVAVGQAAAPAVEKMAMHIQNLANWFKSLPKGVKEAIVNFLLFGGMALIIAGTIARVIYIFGVLGPKLTWIGGIFKWLAGVVVAAATAIGWPLTILIGVIALFAAAWMNNWLGVRDFTKSVLGAIGASIDWLYDRLMRIVLTLQNKAGGMSWAQAWKEAGDAVAAARKKCDEEGTGMEDRFKNTADAAAKSVDAIKAKMGELAGKAGGVLGNILGGAPKGGGENDVLADLKGNITADLGELLKGWADWSKQVSTIFTNMVKNMASTISTGLFDFLTGEFKSFGEYMADFGRSLLKMITDLIAQLIVLYFFKKLFAGTAIGALLGFHSGGEVKHEGGFLYHMGGAIRRAHEGLGVGEVPIVAQTGEGVLSRNGMATLGGAENLNKMNAGQSVAAGPTINLVQVIRAWGPEDVYRERKSLSAAMIDELERNGAFKAAMRKYK